MAKEVNNREINQFTIINKYVVYWMIFPNNGLTPDWTHRTFYTKKNAIACARGYKKQQLKVCKHLRPFPVIIRTQCLALHRAENVDVEICKRKNYFDYKEIKY